MASRYLELNHDLIMFPSWLNHRDLSYNRCREILKAMSWTTYEDLPAEEVTKFIMRFGAVHFSSVFSPLWTGSVEEKRELLFKVGGYKQNLGEHQGKVIEYVHYVDNFLLPLWMQLRKTYASRKTALANSIASVIGATNPTEGLSRSLVTLMNHKIEPLPKSMPSSDDSTAKESYIRKRAAGTTPKSSAPPAPPPPPPRRGA